ncbi:MAG: homocysteine S-methyltransferase family protein [Oscillospiraceae bacterium]|jgi:5-methyltetrahydrofolate--homocysteine methyltransferase|nr:homocysteine S-methyltransferase family protein [Oscillospiraceae bacterium]
MPKLKLFDGSTGALLLAKVPGLKSTELANLSNPGAVSEIHRAYAASGCDVITTNTFAANALNAEKYGYDIGEVVRIGIQLAKEAVQGTNALVGLDIGATGKVLGDDPEELTPERAYEIYAEIVAAAISEKPDLILIETMSSIDEAFIAYQAARDITALPVYVTMSFAENGRTMYGATPEDFAARFEASDVYAIGMNCFVTPEKGYAIFERLKASSTKPLIVQPNGYPGSVADASAKFAKDMTRYIELGASYVGGCCGTVPEDLKRLRGVIDAGL